MQRQQSAFTLVELLIVVIIMGILAATIIPQFTEASDKTRAGTASYIVKGVQRQLSVKKAELGYFPAEIDPTWFEGSVLPTNPFFPNAETTFEIVDRPNLTHPRNKVNSSLGAFWYNRANGIVRARVSAQETNSGTLELYKEVHGSRIEHLGDTKEPDSK